MALISFTQRNSGKCMGVMHALINNYHNYSIRWESLGCPDLVSFDPLFSIK